jgi:TetR/AcrR family transcriptional regulator, transcriptional repressor of aconitase
MPKVSREYRETRRAQIIEAAREVFSRQGLARTSMADLVTATGMSMGALYRYFASKEELVAAVAEGRDGTVDGDFVTAEAPDELLSRLLSYVSGPAGVAHARLSAQIWGEAAIRPALAEVARMRHTALRDHLAGRIQDTRAGRDDPDDADLAEVLLAALVGYANLVASGFDVDPLRFRRILQRLLPAG